MFLFLDKIDLKDNLSEFLDLNSLYEIRISSLKDLNDTQEFDLSTINNVIIEKSYIHDININEIMNFYLVNTNNEQYLIDLTKDSNIIYKNIKKIMINYLDKEKEIKNEIVINVIPVKNEDNFIRHRENKDIKMINLIEKSILLFLFNSDDKIQNLISDYDKDKLVINHAKLYQNEIFKFININKNEIKKNEIQLKESELYQKSNELIEKIKNIMKEEFNNFSLIMKSGNGAKQDEKINKLIKYLIDYFEIYYSKTKNINLKKKSIEIVKSLTLYKASFKMSSIYDIERNKFIAEEYEKEVEKYINNINIKLDFIDLVISSKKQNEKIILPQLSIIDNIFALLEELQNIEIQDIIVYSEIRNINCNLMLKQFQLIKNLLNEIKKEKNLSFLLSIMNQKIRKNHNKGIINYDDIYGANYELMEKLVKEFHGIIEIIYEKNIDEKYKFSNITKYKLLESLLWKIKDRDFDIISKIIKVFENIIMFI